MFQFHRSGGGTLPEGFDDIYICDLLGITYTEYIAQPATWIEQMLLWHTQRAKVDKIRQDEQQRRASRASRKR